AASARKTLGDERLVSGALRDRILQIDLEPVDREPELVERENGADRVRIGRLGLETGVAARGLEELITGGIRGPRRRPRIGHVRREYAGLYGDARQERPAEPRRAHVLRDRRAEAQPLERIVDCGRLPAREVVRARNGRSRRAARLVVRLT